MGRIISKKSVTPGQVPATLEIGEIAINAADGKLHWKDATGAIKETSLFPAPLSSPAFTDTPTAPTPPGGNNSTRLATTEFVQGAVAGRQPLSSALTALAALNIVGLMARSAADTYVARTITGTAGQINVSNGDGAAGNPTLSLDPSIYRGGGTDVAVADGGTGASTAADARTNLGLGTMATQATTSYYTIAAVDGLLAAKLNSSSYTAADVLAKLLTVDGASSGLDADTVDGLQAAAFALASHSHTTSQVTGLDTALGNKAARAQTWGMSGMIAAPANKSYRLVVNIPYGVTINSITTRSASGTCTATFAIDGVNLGGAANAVSATEQTQNHATANVVAAGADITLTISANASCVDLSFTISGTRTLVA